MGVVTAAGRFELANAKRQQGDLDAAVAAYRDAIALDPAHAAAHHRLANTLRAQRCDRDAEAAYRRAVVLDAGNVEALRQYGNVLRDNGKIDDAIACYRAGLALAPGDPAITMQMGLALRRQQRPAEAAECFRSVADSAPEHSEALVQLCHALRELGDEDGLLGSGLRAMRELPHRVDVLAMLLPLLLDRAVQSVATPHGDIHFRCTNDLLLWRAQTLLTKEPETIKWIDAFDEGDVFWDIGANIGVYSLYAGRAGRAGAILAFEPSALNYATLNRNIEVNGLQDRIGAYCIAFNDVTRLDRLFMSSTVDGGALSSFACCTDANGSDFVPSFQQGMIGFSIDDFIAAFAPPFPNRIKIDVDGIEDKLIDGARKTLADSRLKALSIELDDGRSDYTNRIIATIEGVGMRFTAKRHSDLVEQGPFANIFNYHFVRA